MTRLATLFAFLFLVQFSSYAQQQGFVKGVVIDSLKNEPVPFATVSLQDMNYQQLKSTLTKENGAFELALPTGDGFKLVIAVMGYGSKVIDIKGPADLQRVQIGATARQLKEVAVTAVKPLVKQEVDRISYDVQTDAESRVLSVLDMMRKVPMVSVDATDNIKLKGSGNYKILINGRESALVAQNPADVLKSMPAANILKIEVITTPPAKYDAEGLAGIINIITKKDVTQGYNGRISTSYNTVYGPGVSLNATVKQKKIGLNGYIGINRQKPQRVAYSSTNNVRLPVSSMLLQSGQQANDGRNLYGSAELSYEIDSLNLLTGTFQGYGNKNDNNTMLYSTEMNGNGSLARYYQLLNEGTANYAGRDMALNYQLGFKRRKEQMLTFSYKYSLNRNGQDMEARFLQDNDVNHPTAIARNYRQFNTSGRDEQTVQVDYVHPLKTLTIEGGAKGILRKNFSDFQYYNQDASGSYVLANNQSNSLDYTQDVYSAYNSYQLKLKKWAIKGGLRLEHTSVNAAFVGQPLDQNYANLVPSFSMQRILNESNNITVGFSQRVQRPGIWQLNPFVNRANPRYVRTGNPDLRPVRNNSIELNYSNFKKSTFNLSLNYAFANNTVEEVVDIGADTVTTTTYANVGRNRRAGIDINSNLQLTNKLSINLNLELLHVWLSGTYSGQFYSTRGFQGHAFTYTSYKFDKGYSAGMNIGYDSRYVLLQGRDNQYFYYAASLTKEFLDKKASISVNASMPFRKFYTLDFHNTTNEFTQSRLHDVYSRRFNFTFNYKFGKLNGEIKKNKRGISNDDTGGGGRN